ncbi:MAG: hypothetical protein RIS76_2747 [Verrucomicrobiota bacterium]
MKFCRLLLLALACAYLSGCASRFVNLMPRSVDATKSDVYRFEVQWDTSRRGANNADVRAQVMIDETLYPLVRIPGTNDRWEGNIPVPAGKPVISYRYKFDYTYPTFSRRAEQSDLSLPYFLDLRTGTTTQPAASPAQ